MGVRGNQELLGQLPQAVAEPAAAAVAALAELQAVRHAALRPQEVRALGELWERLSAQVASGRLGVLAAMDARDDVIPKAKVGEAGAVFACHALGHRRATARREAYWASLLRPEVGELPAVGAAFAAGDISAAHVEVAVRAHKDLGARARDALVGCEVPDADEGLRAALAGLSDAFTAMVRQIRVVDVLLAHYARRMTVAELEAIAGRIVQTLNPPDPKGAHERRFLHMSQLPSGEWRGRFSCGPDQGLRLKRALAAWSRPRPGKAIDQDGVEHQIPDTRDLGARQMDAVTDIVNGALAKTGITLPTDPSTLPHPERAQAADAGAERDDGAGGHHGHHGDRGDRGDRGDGGDGEDGEDGDRFWHARDLDEDERGPDKAPSDQPDQPDQDQLSPGEASEEPPPGEGEVVVLREPGAPVAPYPSADLVLVAGIEHVAAAFAHRPQGLPVRLEENFNAWVRDRFSSRFRSAEQQAEQQADEQQAAEETPPGERSRGQRPPDKDSSDKDSSDKDSRGEEPPESSARTGGGIRAGNCDCQPERRDTDLAWLGRALSPYGVPARVEHAGLVDATTLELLACTATVRAALLAPNGALLDLGRAQRLATPAQKTALLARDGGCVIPGCTVPGDACDAHHVQWWTRGGQTDLDNLTLLCGRHHTEVHQDTWHIQMLDGIPWVTPPSWTNPRQTLLRNAVHHPQNHGPEAA